MSRYWWAGRVGLLEQRLDLVADIGEVDGTRTGIIATAGCGALRAAVPGEGVDRGGEVIAGGAQRGGVG